MKRYKARIFFLFVVLAGIVALVPVNTASAGSGATANVSLTNSSAGLTQTGNTSWTLAKTGAVDKANSTVIWTITATEVATVAGHLVVNGTMTVSNSGAGGATIGNIVVNLQTRVANKWVTRSSDVADATSDDAATSANIVPSASAEHLSSFTENAASGALQLMDAGTNTIFPLVPQVTIAPGATVTLLFLASFDNNVLGLPVGTPTRAEIILSFGNATANGKSAANIDINGNGIIDADENWVRSVASRLGLSVPAQVPGDATATLTDTLDDITTTGTITFSNVQFNLGATGGTVTVSYDAGTDGGTITDCAHLTSNSLNLEACNTQTISGRTCTPGAPGCGWETGDMLTFNQSQWGDLASSGGTALAAHYNSVYSATGGVLEVGILGAGGFSMAFTSADAVATYLPANGSIGPLTSDLMDPTSSSSGDFGGEVVALALNVDYSDAGFLGAAAHLGDLRICNFGPLPVLNGMTVRQVLASANTLLGGGTASFNLSQATTVANFINNSFTDGNPSTFAQDNLVNGACPWQQGNMLTYVQSQWGDPASTAGSALAVYYAAVYAGTGGVLEVGISGASGFSMIFNVDDAVQAYLPASGVIGALTSDLINPTTSSSGDFGGEVVALQLNVNFSESGYLGGTTQLGNLRICNFSQLPIVNNLTVSQFLAIANHVLGGGSATINVSQAATIANLINGAFADGNPSTFAQDNLVNGACPWKQGDMLTYPQGDWGDSPAASPAAALLDLRWDQVYASTFGVLEVGIPGTSGFSLVLDSANGALDYLPAVGPVGALTSDLSNPTSSSAGSFGGDVVTLALNSDFSAAGFLAGVTSFGSLNLCGVPGLPNMSVNTYRGVANIVLGGGSSGYDLVFIATLTSHINAAFLGGTPSTFAQEHLVNGACP